MKKIYLFKEEEYKENLQNLKNYVNALNQHWEDLNKPRKMTAEDVDLLASNKRQHSDKVWDYVLNETCREYNMDRNNFNKYSNGALDMMTHDACRKKLPYDKAVREIEKEICAVNYWLTYTPYIEVSDKGVTINEQAVKDFFSVIITNSKQEKALKIFDNIIKEYKELKKMGITTSIDYFINYNDDTIYKESIINALKEEEE